MMKILLMALVFTAPLTGYSKSNSFQKTWNKARSYALKKQNNKAIREYKKLLKFNKKTDEITLHIARTYYAKNDLKNAIKYYKNVPKTSAYWLEAIEELAWSYTRSGEYGKSYAQILTLLSPTFGSYVNAEAYYLASINRYFVCDYQGVFKNSKKMKKEFKTRIVNLQKVVNGQSAESVSKMIEASKSGITFSNMAQFADKLPKYFYRDAQISRALNAKRVSQSRIQSRLAKLAQSELAEIQSVIEKIGVVEAEVIQRVYVQNNKPKKSKEVLQQADGVNTLSFPVENDEVWIDELNSYQVSTSRCPNRIYKEASL